MTKTKAILILFLVSLPPLLWWFPVGSVVDGTDINAPLKPSLSLLKALFAWDPINLTGSSQTAVQLNLSKVPIYLYLTLFELLNFPLWLINRFWYWAYLFFPSLAYFLFLTELFNKKPHKNLIGLVASSFYIYNLYYVQQIIDQAITLSLIFTPLYLFFILKTIRTGKVLFYSLLIGLLNFLYTSINPNSYLVGVIVIAFFTAILIGQLLIQKSWKNISRLIQLIILSTFFGLLSLAYFIIPTFHYLQDSTQNIKAIAESADWLTGVSRTTSFSNVTRLLGAWDWYEGHNGEYYAPFAQVYQNIFFSLLAFLPPLMAVLALFVSRDKWKYSFFLLAIAGVFLAMGSHPPTGRGYVFLYNHLPLFWIFRSPWYKFSFFIVFAYSALIGLFAEKLFSYLPPKKTAFVLIIIFIVLAHPIFLGNRFTKPEDRQGNLSAIANFIPNYVFETAGWFNNRLGQERIILVPQIAWESTAYTWEYGNLVPPVYSLLDKNPILYLPYYREGPGIDLLKAAKVALYTPDSTPSANYLAFLNTRYLLNQKDFSYWYFRGPDNSELVESYIESQKDFQKIHSVGPWDIYETQKYLPKIYSPEEIYTLNDIYEAGNLNLDSQPAFFMQADKPASDFPKSQPKVKIDFKYVDPVTYQLSYNSQQPLVIVFLEAFDKNWKLYSRNTNLEYDHFKINNYANGYLIKNTGELKIEIKNSSQKYFNQGRNISIGTLIIIIIAVILIIVKDWLLKRKSYEKK